MQNRYSGDIGDFSKLGLLRSLMPSGISIGINWYIVPDETHNDDGKFTQYLEKDSFRNCDEALCEELKHVVNEKKRKVSALQKESILTATHFSEFLKYSGKTKSERKEVRRLWHDKALSQLSDSGIICADPDNGLIVPSSKDTMRDNKYILPKEIRDYYLQGSSVIYYQHKARRKDTFYIDQHRCLMNDPAFKGASGMILKFIPTSQRYYCFIIRPNHEAGIRKAVDNMLQTPWNQHFVLL